MVGKNASTFSSFDKGEADSAGLRPLIAQLTDCLHEGSLSEQGTARETAARILEQLESVLLQYQFDMDADGPLHNALNRNPWMTARIQHLRQQQVELHAMLRSLLDLARNARDWNDSAPQLHWTFEHFGECCRAFDSAIQDALHEAFPGPEWLEDANGDFSFP